MSKQRARWICANCGARHESNDQPCRECAGEQFARLEEPERQRLEQTEDVRWRCKNCGEMSPRNGTQCRNCGGFQYERVVTAQSDSHRVDDNIDADADKRMLTLPLVVSYVWGGFLALSTFGSLIQGAILGGITMLIAATVTIPFTRHGVEDALNLEISAAAAAGLSIGLYLIGLWLAAPYV